MRKELIVGVVGSHHLAHYTPKVADFQECSVSTAFCILLGILFSVQARLDATAIVLSRI